MWIKRITKTSCRRCKVNISKYLHTATTTQHSIIVDEHNKALVCTLLNEGEICKQGVGKVLSKKICRWLYRPGGIMMRKEFQKLETLQ